MERRKSAISEMNDRSREVFTKIVDAYVATGEPIGSRTLSKQLSTSLSATTVRNVMADLEDLGLLYSPHTSAGRLPTEQGLRLFVDGLLEVGNLSSEDRNDIEAKCVGAGRSVNQVLEEASSFLGGLSNCAGLVLAPKSEENLRHVEFVRLGPGHALVVMVFDNGTVENRIIDLPLGLPASSLIEASNYLSAKFIGRNLSQAAIDVALEIRTQRAEIDTLSQKVVEAGLATWSGDSEDGVLIVRGQAKLLKDVTKGNRTKSDGTSVKCVFLWFYDTNVPRTMDQWADPSGQKTEKAKALIGKKVQTTVWKPESFSPLEWFRDIYEVF